MGGRKENDGSSGDRAPGRHYGRVAAEKTCLSIDPGGLSMFNAFS